VSDGWRLVRPSDKEELMSHVASKDGTRIAFDKTGRGSGVILVDGALAYRGYRGGRALAAELSRDFTVISYDRRGRGESTDTQPYAWTREVEDIAALIDEVGAPVCLYGFSSGAVLALKAAATLGREKVAKLALLEPPFNGDDDRAREESLAFSAQMARLLAEGKNSDAVAFFLQDMMPPDVLESMKRSPEWTTMEAVAPTLAYENAVMGDGSVPTDVAATVTVPALVLDGGDSEDFKHTAADALAKALPQARRKTLAGQSTQVPAEVLAPALVRFFADALR
jgi:pimeloyl-ACP methyl ester carboxylesterase